MSRFAAKALLTGMGFSTTNDNGSKQLLNKLAVVCLDAAILAHESGDLEAIETDYEELDAELPRNAGPEFDKLHVAFEFWSGWIDARNHDWLYYPGIEAGDWPRLARGIVQDLSRTAKLVTISFFSISTLVANPYELSLGATEGVCSVLWTAVRDDGTHWPKVRSSNRSLSATNSSTCTKSGPR